MLPSEIRRIILEQHADLRVDLDAREKLCSRVLSGDPSFDPTLRERGEAFQRRFLEHLAFEDANLNPVLREADAWGDARVEQLLGEHEQQRVFLSAILASLHDSSRPPLDIALELCGLVAVILDCLAHEDEAVLDPKVLRDDVVSASMEAG